MLCNLQVWWSVLGRNGGCRIKDGSRGLVLDIGSNFGYYAIYSAAIGCRYASPHSSCILDCVIDALVAVNLAQLH